jgi:undecaprenyl pyrophosphate synthase
MLQKVLEIPKGELGNIASCRFREILHVFHMTKVKKTTFFIDSTDDLRRHASEAVRTIGLQIRKFRAAVRSMHGRLAGREKSP